MTYHSVIDFIRAGRACGLSDDEVGERLKRGGWLEVDVKDAFELVSKMESVPQDKQNDPVICPPDHAEQAPTPQVSDRLLSGSTPHLSASRVSMWLVLLLVAFYAGFALMR